MAQPGGRGDAGGPLPDASRPDGLAPEFGLSEAGLSSFRRQGHAILELRLQRLGLEQDKIVSEYERMLIARILDLLDILADGSSSPKSSSAN